MFSNYFKVAWRNLAKFKGHSLINIAGLAIGIAFCVLTFLFVQYEHSFDNFHKNGNRIYLAGVQRAVQGGRKPSASTPPVLAEKYFGDADALEQEVTVRIRNGEITQVVKGIVDLPPNSSLQFDFLIPHVLRGKWGRGWRSNNVYTFLRLVPGVKMPDMKEKFFTFFAAYFKESSQDRTYFGSPENPLSLIPLKKLYLNTIYRKWLTLQSDPAYSYILSGIALAVLLIACVNFVNLSLGLSSHRSREVGMRKVVGASRSQLIKQYLSESVLLSFISLLAGMGLALLALPTFSRLMDRDLIFNVQTLWIPLFCLIFLVGILAGFYPALVLSGFHPIEILKGRFQIRGKRRLSSSLVVLQFALSIILIISTFAMARQMQHMKEKNLGFNADQVVVIDGGGWSTGLNEMEMRRVLNLYRQVSSQRTDVVSGTMSSMSFGRGDLWGTGFLHEDEEVLCRMYSIDYDYIKTLGMKLIKGREFSRDFPSDDNDSVMVNERLVQVLGMDDPLGKTIPSDNDMLPGRIIGVLEDSHLRSLHYEVEPAVFHLRAINGSFRYILVRITSKDLEATLKVLQDIWRDAVPYRPFIYNFMDEDVDRVFKEDQRWAEIAFYSAGFAILIACLGAFGLISLAVARRTKEVGIRKVLGASDIRIATLLSRDFFKLVLLSNVIAWPFAFLLLRNWLQDFAYRIELGMGFFIFGSVVTLLVALGSISTQVVKAARANPVDSLRYE